MANKVYKVKRGDCIASIAYEHGWYPDTIWDDPNNSDLKQKRQNPNILLEGDVVVIPEKRIKEESVSSEQTHRFRRKGVPETVRLQLLDNGTPQKNVNYIIEIEGRLINGTTDDQGWLEHTIPPDAKEGTLLIEGDEKGNEKYTVWIGDVDPIDTNAGLAARLRNLGFLEDEEEEDEEIDDEIEQEASELGLVTKNDEDGMAVDLRDAISAFQDYYGLPVTGEADAKTREKLVEIHQC